MKHLIISLVLVFLMDVTAMAPVNPGPEYRVLKVRLTAYSPKQPRENHKTATGKSARNEKGVAAHKSFLPLGTMIILPNGEMRVVDDRIPYKSAKRFDCRVIDVRYYQSIDAPTKTKAVTRELKKEFDMGYGYIKVLK